MTAHSRAMRSNSRGLWSIILATSASWGSFGSGVLNNDCSEIRADLIVRTGDQALDNVSRQIAPCEFIDEQLYVYAPALPL
jgi:hypothetical protein